MAAALRVPQVLGRAFVPESVEAAIADDGIDAVDQPVLPGFIAENERFRLGGRLQFQANPVRDSHMSGREPGLPGDRLPSSALTPVRIQPACSTGVDVAIVHKWVMAGGDIEGRRSTWPGCGHYAFLPIGTNGRMIQQERAGGNAGGRSDGWAARSRFRKQGEPRVRVGAGDPDLKTPHRFPAGTPESASPLGEGEE